VGGQVLEAEMVLWVTLAANHPATRIMSFGEVFMCIGGSRYLNLNLMTNPPKILQDMCRPVADKELERLISVFS